MVARSTQSAWSRSGAPRTVPWSAPSATFVCTCTPVPAVTTSSTLAVEDKEVILQAIRQPSTSTPSHHRLLAKLNNLETLIRVCTNDATLSAVEKHITAAASVLKALTSEAGVGVLPKTQSSQYAMFYALEQGFTFTQVSFAEPQGFLLLYTHNFHIFAGGHPSDQAVDGVANNSMPCNLRTQHTHIPQARDLPLVTYSNSP